MPYSNIDKPNKYFNTIAYAGAGGTQSVTGTGFQPDFVWIKNRSITADHMIYDAVRGTGSSKALTPDNTDAEGLGTNVGLPSQYGYLSAFGSDGFTVVAGSVGGNFVNSSGNNFVSWNWLGANTTVSNTSGTISSTVSANTTSGFSIVSYTGNGSNSTVGHGLGVAPAFIIFKNRSSTTGWACYNKNIGASKYLALNETIEAQTATGVSNSTDPTSSVFSIGTADRVNTNGNNYIAYCFAEIKGFSKFSSFVGNGSTNGAFVYTGFKPAFVMIKSSSTGGAGYNWGMWDNKRDGYNVNNNDLRANLGNAESTDDSIDLLSNGFKIRTDSGGFGGGSGITYIYMAFAENPFVSSKSIPTTAR
jgi:hypothetical protein